MNEYTFSFKEVLRGSITIKADQQPSLEEVEEAIMNGGAFIKDSQYEDITLDILQPRSKPQHDYER